MKEIDTGVKPVLQAAMAPMKLKAMIATIINPFMFTSANKGNRVFKARKVISCEYY